MVATRVQKDEIDILYAASNQLTKASTPLEQLEAVSEYARDLGASSGALLYLSGNTEDELVGEIAAEWLRDEGVAQGVGQRFSGYGSDDASVGWMAKPDQPMLVMDAINDQRFRPDMRAQWVERKISSYAILPLNNRGRWVGLITFGWTTPYTFTERDERIYTALIQQAAPTIDSIRLLEQNRERALRAERLLRINTALSQATDESEILSAIAQYAVRQGARRLFLDYADVDEAGKTIDYNIVAMWENGVVGQYDPNIHEVYKLADLDFPPLWEQYPEDVAFIENFLTSPYFSEDVKTHILPRVKGRAMAIIPLYGGGRFQGFISIVWFEPHNFTDEERNIFAALMQTVPSVVASRRAYLAEEAARRENEFLYRMGEAINAATSMQEILEAVAKIDTGSQAIILFVWENYDYESARYLEVIAAVRSETGLTPLVGERYPVEAFPVTEWMPHEGVWVIENTLTDPRVDEVTASTWASIGTYALIGTAISRNGRWMAGLTFHSNQPRSYTARDIRLTTGIGDLVLAAFERIRLQAETQAAYLAEQERGHELETVAKVSAAAARILDVQVLMKTVVELTQLNFADYHLAIYLLDSSGQVLEKAASAASDHEVPRGFSLSLNDKNSLIAQAGYTRRSIVLNDTSNAGDYTHDAYCSDTHSEMAIPMVVADNLIGVLDVQSPTINRFSDTNARVMAMLADLIAVAIQNARLYEQAQEMAALEERNRLARELHDSVSQALYGIALGARTARTLLHSDPSRLAEPLDYILTLAEAGLTEMRALIFDLRPESLENEGLVTALAKQATVMQSRHGVIVQTEFCEEPALPLEVKEMLYRIAREALHNTIKHAQASEVNLRLNELPGSMILEIADNGHGFDTDGSFPGHLGLKSMRERAARLNAVLLIDSAPNRGTRISVHIPRAPD